MPLKIGDGIILPYKNAHRQEGMVAFLIALFFNVLQCAGGSTHSRCPCNIMAACHNKVEGKRTSAQSTVYTL